MKRPHSDLDLSIPRDHLTALRRHLVGKLNLWSADQETLRILILSGADRDSIADSCENVWARRSGADPWLYDIILMSVTDDMWVFKKDARVSRPVDEIVWRLDGIPYLRPAVQLLHKAGGRRPKDEADFEATWRLLDLADRRWLCNAIGSAHPGHRWIDVLQV